MFLVNQCDVSVGELTADEEMKEDSEHSSEEDEHDDKLAVFETSPAAPRAEGLLLFHLLSVHQIILQFG